jgi:hypothetical protein
MSENDALGREWTTLQHHHERYEFGALAIKLTALVLFFAATVLVVAPEFVSLLMAVLWLQEGIFKTFQARLGERLLAIERSLSGDEPTPAFALHSGFLATRKGAAGLVREYLASAARPTVAFPYALLLVLAWWLG